MKAITLFPLVAVVFVGCQDATRGPLFSSPKRRIAGAPTNQFSWGGWLDGTIYVAGSSSRA